MVAAAAALEAVPAEDSAVDVPVDLEGADPVDSVEPVPAEALAADGLLEGPDLRWVGPDHQWAVFIVLLWVEVPGLWAAGECIPVGGTTAAVWAA